MNVLSSAGASILGVGYLLPMVYLMWSLRYGRLAGSNPWGAVGLEWNTTSPPPTENFAETPVVTGTPTNIRRRWRDTLPDTFTRGAATTPIIRRSRTISRTSAQQNEAATLGMWVFLVTEVLFFGGLFTAYSIYRAWYPEAFAVASHELDVTARAPSTPSSSSPAA